MKLRELLDVLTDSKSVIFSGTKEINLDRLGLFHSRKLYETDVIDVRTTSSGTVHNSVDEKQFPIEETPMEFQLRDILATLDVDAKIFFDEDDKNTYVFLDVENREAHLFNNSRLSISHKDGFVALESYLTHAISKISIVDTSTIAIYVKP